jgi:hypothetical protein
MRARLKTYYSFFFVIIIALGLMLFYLLTYSMYEIEEYTVNDPGVSTKLLIATQGSEFKDRVTQNIIAHYKPDQVFIEIIDISKLYDIRPENFDAIVIMHTWEYGMAPEDVKQFLLKNNTIEYKTVILATSGDGDNKIKGIDAITGESKLESASYISNEIVNKIDQVFKKQ